MTPTSYLLTFCSYGSWLPGDRRGWIDHTPGPDPQPHQAPPNRLLRIWIARRLPQPPFMFHARARAVIEAAIREQCAHAGWTLHALHIRTQHLHIVLTGAAPAERMMAKIKACATRRLREQAVIDDETRPWSRGGSMRLLPTPEDVERACHYVVDGQGGPLRGSW